ncbi:MAG: Asp23/Gls24 family envelope stress response protein [Clostridia bacterium]
MKIVNHKFQNGRIVYNSQIVRDVVDCAVGEVNGVVKFDINSKLARDYIKIDQIDGELYINISVKLLHSVNVKDTASILQHTVKNAIETMTDFKVKNIDIHVIDVAFIED